MSAGLKLPLPWMPSQAIPPRLPPVQLPRDERPHDRSLEWWHFMGHFRLLHPYVKDVGADPVEDETSHTYEKDTSGSGGAAPPRPREAQGAGEDKPQMSFVLSILKARIQGVTKLASLVILIDHQRETHTASIKLGALGGSYFEPTDGSAFKFHFGPPGPARPGPPEAWSAEGGMGIYQLTIDTSRQLSLALKQFTPAVLVGVRPEEPDAPEQARAPARRDTDPPDGVMQYIDGDEMGYYAFPALVLDGVLGVGGQEQAIVGRAWMEHQWGDFPLGDYQWKYLAIDVLLREEGREEHAQLLVFKARKRARSDEERRDPEVRAQRREEDVQHAVWVAPGGDYAVLRRRDIQITDVREEDFDGFPVVTRISCDGGAHAGVAGTVRIPKLRLAIEPIFRDQECRTELPASIFPVFWEGACSVTQEHGCDARVSAGSWAITELAGYE